MNIIITPLSRGSADIDAALVVLNDSLGAGYVSSADLAAYIAPTSTKKLCLIAKDRTTNAVIGVVTAEIVDAARLRLTLLDNYDAVQHEEPVRRLHDHITGLIKSVAVVRAARKNGVGTALVRQAMEALGQHGARAFYAIGWITDDAGCHIQGVLEALRFTPVRRLDRFWYNDSIAHQYDCPQCGRPCRCAAMLLIRTSDTFPDL